MNGKYGIRRGAGAISSGPYLGIFSRSENLEPEKALLLAVLEDAIHCFPDYRVAHDRGGQQRFREADNWIHRQGRDWTFTFDNLCEMLGIEPDYLCRRVFEEQKSGNMAYPPSEYLHGSVKPRHSPKRASIGGLVEVLDRG